MRTIELQLNPETGNYEAGTLEASDQDSELSQAGVFGGAASFNFGGVPIGAAIVGGLTAGAFDAIIRLFPTVDIPGINIPTNVRLGIIFFIASWAAQTEPFRNFLGREGAEATSLILAADGVQEFVNLRGILGGILGRGSMSANNAGDTGQTAIETQMAQLRAQLQGMGVGGLQQVPAIAQARQALAGL